MDQAHTIVIVGCGYLGLRLARRHPGTVIATCRSAAGRARAQAAGCDARCLDVGDRPAVDRFIDSLPEGALSVHYLVPPGLRGGAAGDQIADDVYRFARRLRGRSPAVAILASSTAVYGDRAGGSVSADTPADPDDARGRALLAIEQAWINGLANAKRLRLAGIYGPGRIVGERGLRAGTPIGADPDGWLNLIQVDDAAALLDAFAGAGAAIELGADGVPVRRRDYYAFLAGLLGVDARFAEPTSGGRGSRRCAIEPTCARTGWRPVYEDYRHGLRAAFGAAP
ncbi:MAG: hypothetical protein AB7Q97_13590 [Gammaproteobacteria bacterium]